MDLREIMSQQCIDKSGRMWLPLSWVSISQKVAYNLFPKINFQTLKLFILSETTPSLPEISVWLTGKAYDFLKKECPKRVTSRAAARDWLIAFQKRISSMVAYGHLFKKEFFQTLALQWIHGWVRLNVFSTYSGGREREMRGYIISMTPPSKKFSPHLLPYL